MKHYIFGADVGGTTVKLGVFTPDGTLLDKWEIPTRTEQDGSLILPDIARAIREKAAALPEEHSILGVGIGVPGPVDDAGVVNRCVNLGWGVFDVAQALSGLLDGIPVRAGNDANVAALGEMWQGGGKGHKNVVMVTLGTGVGGGVIVDGRFVSGQHGAAGEIGHMMMRPDEPEACTCGKRGCLEQYASATGIVAVAKRRLRQDDRPTALRALAKITAKDVCDLARTEDAVAVDVLDEVCSVLGQALSLTSAVSDPDIYVIGGGVANAGAVLIDRVEQYFKQYVFHASRNTGFAQARLGNDAGIYGCAKLIADLSSGQK